MSLSPGSGKRLVVFLLLAVQLCIYSSFLTTDMITGGSEHPWSRIVKFVSIVLCFGLTLLVGPDGHDRRDVLLIRIALGLTCVADFLIGLAGLFIAGIAVFFFVQLTLILRHSRGFVRRPAEAVAAACVFLPVFSLLAVLAPHLIKSGLMIPVTIYALTLATSLWIAIGTIWRRFYPRTIDWFIVVGMANFFLCDLNVGLYQVLPPDGNELVLRFWHLPAETLRLMPELRDAPAALRVVANAREIVGILVWFFYLPAQLLLTLSAFRTGFLRGIFPLLPELSDD